MKKTIKYLAIFLALVLLIITILPGNALYTRNCCDFDSNQHLNSMCAICVKITNVLLRLLVITGTFLSLLFIPRLFFHGIQHSKSQFNFTLISLKVQMNN